MWFGRIIIALYQMCKGDRGINRRMKFWAGSECNKFQVANLSVKLL